MLIQLRVGGSALEKPPPYAYLAFCLNAYGSTDCSGTTSCPFQTGTYCPEDYGYCFIVYHLTPFYPNPQVTIVIAQTAGPNIVYVGPPTSSLFTRFFMPTPAPGTTNTFTLLSVVFSNGDVFDTSLSEQVVLSILPGPNSLSIAQNGQACFDQTVQLVASGGGVTDYQWSNGLAGPTISVFQPGVYSVTASTADGCSATASTTVVNPFPFSLVILPTSNLCQGQPSTATVQPATGATFIWSNGQTGPTTTFTPPATFSVTATASATCSATVSVTFPGFPPPIPGISGAGFICPGQTVNLATIGSFLSYLWSNGAQTPAIQTTLPGSFSVTVTDVYGCTGSSTTTVTAAVAPTISLSAMPDVCQNACQNITATLTGDAAFFFFLSNPTGRFRGFEPNNHSNGVAARFSVCPPGPAGNSVQIVACTVNDAVCP